MQLDRALKLQEESHKRRIKIRKRKANDYAIQQVDCLSNFKVIAEIAEVMKKHGYEIDITKAWGTAMWHLLHKFVRIVRLYTDNLEPQNESIVDSHDDLENYSELAKECFIDEERPL